MNTRRTLWVFISWKDIRNPAAGGAEWLQQELSTCAVNAGWDVVHLVPGFPGALPLETIDGVRIERVGHSVFSFLRLARVYRKRYRKRADVLTDVFTCIGSGAVFYRGPRVRSLLIHHVQKQMWFYQTVFPGVSRGLMPVLAPLGYVLEAIELFLLAHLFNGPVLTVSRSTRRELRRYGFPPHRIHIVPEAISLSPLETLEHSAVKESIFTVLLMGPRKSKRPLDTLRAFALFQRSTPHSALWIAGWGTEQERLIRWAERHGVKSVRAWGRIDPEQKRQLMQRAHVLCTSPVKEGWGLVVTEANAMGTPAVGYEVPGLRDALAASGGSGCAPNPVALAGELNAVYRRWHQDPAAYEALRSRSLESARRFTPAALSRAVFSALQLSSSAQRPAAGKSRIDKPSKRG